MQMEFGADIPKLARWLRGLAVSAPPPPRPFSLIAIGALLLMSGCGPGGHPDSHPSSMVVGRRAAPLPPAQLATAAAAARRFALAYAETAYLPRPPHLPGVSASVDRHLRAAARRVPESRRGRRPRVTGLELRPAEGTSIAAGLRIDDGISPPYSIGFTMKPRRGGWRIVSISTPE
jgi:hypothetical protein